MGQKASVFNAFPYYITLRPDTALFAFGCSVFSPSISQRYCWGAGPVLPPYSGAIGNCRFQTLIQQQKAGSLPVQCLEPVPPSPTEQKQRPLKGIHLKLRFYQSRSVYPQAMYTGQLQLKSFSMTLLPGELSAVWPRPLSHRPGSTHRLPPWLLRYARRAGNAP